MIKILSQISSKMKIVKTMSNQRYYWYKVKKGDELNLNLKSYLNRLKNKGINFGLVVNK